MNKPGGLCALTVVWLLAMCSPTAALAQPVGAEVAQLETVAKRLRRTRPGPEMLADCLRLVSALDAVEPEQILATLAPVARRWFRPSEPVSEPAATTLRALLREVIWRADRPADRSPWRDASAEVRAWSALGPFDSGHGSAYDRLDAIESERDAAPTYAGRDGPIQWQSVPAVLAQHSTGLRLNGLFERSADAIVYARSFIRLPKASTVRLRLAAVGPARLMVDGVRVLQSPRRASGSRPRPALLLPQQSVTLFLAAGWHQLRVKLAAEQGRIWLGLEVLDDRDRPAKFQQRATPPGEEGTMAPEPPQGLAGDTTWQRDLLARAQSPGGDRAQASLAMASMIGWPLHADVGRQLKALLATEVSVEVAAIATQIEPEVGDRIARLRQLVTAHPEAAELRVALATALDEMGKSAAAHKIWQTGTDAEPLAAHGVRACAIRTNLWLRLGADLAALETARSCRLRWPRSPLALMVPMRLARARDHLSHAANLGRELVALEPGRLDRRAELVAAHIQAGDLAAAAAAAKTLERRAPAGTLVAEMMAGALAAERDWPVARAWLKRMPRWRWRSSTFELSARIAAAGGHRQRAIADLRSALQRAPSRSELRARLRLLEPPRGFYEAHRRDLVALARTRKGKPASAPLTRLLRQTVIQVLGGGRQARYEVDVIAVGRGGPGEHHIEVPFVPSQSSVEILRAEVVRADGRIERKVSQDLEQLSEGSVGLYYDLEQIKLGFKNLKPGDVLLVEAVTRDFAGDPFGFVFGELLPLAGHRPIVETEIVVQLPAGTPLHHVVWDPRRTAPRPVKLKRLAGSTASVGRIWDVWRLNLHNTPAVVAEHDMPGVSEVVPYLHMSSFDSWTAATRWYGGLLRQSMPTVGGDPQLARLAASLVVGKQDLASRVHAVYRHVADKIRYVGLEFGIHSLQPHAPALVLQRQFGDCKDKATLIVALLAELGIPAEVALVRTADNGRLGDGVASLGVFNHAIAYVPGLNWWLDGTVQGHAPGEVPEGNAGGVALRIPLAVTRSDAEDLPLAPAEANLRDERLDIRLAANGDAEVAIEMRFRGLPAAEVRSHLHAPATRKERLEEDLTRRFPGMTLTSCQVAGIQPVLRQVLIRVRGRVPNWATVAANGLRLQPMRRSVALVRQLAATSEREHAFVQRWAGLSTQRLRIVPPAGMAVRQAPQPLRLVDDLLHFELRVQLQADGSLVLHKRFARQRKLVPAKAWSRWRLALGRVDSALGGVVTLAPPAAVAP